MNNKIILDACCGGKMFWYNKNHPNTTYMDIRKEDKGHSNFRPNHEVNPDIVADFKDIPFEDKKFKLVVFDPPQMFLGEKAEFTKRYGRLTKDTWKEEIKKGFNECWRVLEDYGVLIFKWHEWDIKKEDVLKVIGKEPLFGHVTNRSTKNNIWFTFMKIPEGVEVAKGESKGCGKRLPTKKRQVRDSLVCDKYQLCDKCKEVAVNEKNGRTETKNNK